MSAQERGGEGPVTYRKTVELSVNGCGNFNSVTHVDMAG